MFFCIDEEREYFPKSWFVMVIPKYFRKYYFAVVLLLFTMLTSTYSPVRKPS